MYLQQTGCMVMCSIWCLPYMQAWRCSYAEPLGNKGSCSCPLEWLEKKEGLRTGGVQGVFSVLLQWLCSKLFLPIQRVWTNCTHRRKSSPEHLCVRNTSLIEKPENCFLLNMFWVSLMWSFVKKTKVWKPKSPGDSALLDNLKIFNDHTHRSEGSQARSCSFRVLAVFAICL